MKKKKVLIVHESFQIGGIESASVALANELQKTCEVDVLAFVPRGPLKEQLHRRVHVLTPSWRMQALGVSMRDALHSGGFRMLLAHGAAAAWGKIVDNTLPIRWMLAHEPRRTGYDLAIAFRQEPGKHDVCGGFSRYVDQCVEAKVKAVWLHYDPLALDLDSAFNLPFYRRMDKVVLVSRSLMERFVSRYPDLREKADYCYNVLDREKLLAMSEEPQAVRFPAGRTICFSACRLAEEKALVRGIRALEPTFRAHPELLWYIAGDGPEKGRVQREIAAMRLEKQILLMGGQKNPYPYMRNADLLLNVSFHEAAPMVFGEAHALGVPVFATRTSSAQEMLRDGKTDFLCENTEDGIRETFAQLMNDPRQLHQAGQLARAAHWDDGSSADRIGSWLKDRLREKEQMEE